MLPHLALIFTQIFKVLGLCVILIGVLHLVGALLNMKGPDGYVKGGILIFIGNWIARLGG